MPQSKNTIKVNVEIRSGRPVFHFYPPQLDVDIEDNERVVWVFTDSTTGFDFAALAFPKRNPFVSVVVHADRITALDYYEAQKGPTDFTDHDYSVLVATKKASPKDIPTYYNSADWGPYHTDTGDPTIRNK